MIFFLVGIGNSAGKIPPGIRCIAFCVLIQMDRAVKHNGRDLMLHMLGDDAFYVVFIFYLKITVVVDDDVEICRPIIFQMTGEKEIS